MFRWFANLFVNKATWKLYRYYPEKDEKAYINITALHEIKSIAEVQKMVDALVADGWVLKEKPMLMSDCD